MTLWKLWAMEQMQTWSLLATGLWAIKSFVFDSGVSCLLPASMKLWQVSLLDCKQDTIVDFSQFLTTWSSMIEMETHFPRWKSDKLSFVPGGSHTGPSRFSNYPVYFSCPWMPLWDRHGNLQNLHNGSLAIRLCIARKTKGKLLA